MNGEQLMQDFIRIARAIYMTAYGEDVDGEVTVDGDMNNGKKIIVTITIEEQEEFENETD